MNQFKTARFDGARWIDQAQTLRMKTFGRKTLPPIVAVTGGQEGIGKSSITLNLACRAAKSGKKVLILNAGAVCFVPSAFTATQRPPRGLEDFAVVLQDGLTLIPAGVGLFAESNREAEVLSEAQNENDENRVDDLLLELDDFMARFDLVFLDAGSSLGQRLYDVLLVSDRIVMVTTPDPASLMDSYTAIKAVVGKDPSKTFSVIVNRVGNGAEGRRIFERIESVVAKYLGIQLESLGEVPEDPFMSLSHKKRSPLVSCYPGSPASLAVHGLAERLLTQFQKTAFRGSAWIPKRLRTLVQGFLGGPVRVIPARDSIEPEPFPSASQEEVIWP